MSLDGLRHRADLVDFEQQAVARFAFHAHRDALRVRHRQVVADDLRGRDRKWRYISIHKKKPDAPKADCYSTKVTVDAD